MLIFAVWVSIGIIWALCLDDNDRRFKLMTENRLMLVVMVVFWFPLMIVLAEGQYEGD